MKTEAVAYDSSALLTLILQEQGWQAVRAALGQDRTHIVPSPAITEVVFQAREKGNASSPEQLVAFVDTFGVQFESLHADDALRAAELQEISRANPGPGRRGRHLTLSLGDALILAIAERCAATVISKDRYWVSLDKGGHLRVKVASLAPRGPRRG